MNILEKKHIGVLYEDDHIVALDKPSPFLTIPDRYIHSEESLYTLLKLSYNEIFVVHRLDRETSGVILFAKNPEAHRILSMAFEGREVKKEYIAIVQGIPAEKDGVIDMPIAEHPSKKGMMIPSKHGKESVTEYHVIESYDRFSLLSLFPQTGRTHQIRVHCKAIGHPLAVDPMYSERKAFYLSEIKKKYKRGDEFAEERPIISRCTLHAKSIRFKHPADGRDMFIESPVPKDMNALISQLSKLKRGR